MIPSGKHTETYGTSQFVIGKLTNSIAIEHLAMLNYQRVINSTSIWWDFNGNFCTFTS